MSNRKTCHRKLVVLGQVPPPFHGQAVAIAQLVDGLKEELDLVHVPMRFSETVYENGRMRFQKVVHLFQVILRTLLLLIRHRGSVLYYPPAPASWVPAIRDLIILSVARPFAGKVVFHFHAHGIGGFLERERRKLWWSWAWRRPDHAIVVGKSCIEDAQKLLPDRISVIPFGVDLEPAARKRSGATTLRVLYVGMLAEPKGLFELLETAHELRDLDIEFRLVGTFKYKETQPRFERRRDELKLSERVLTLGRKTGDELWQEYADSDVFFFPTRFETETFGLVVLEAMAHALPVVASDWRGPKDIVVHGETGFLCEPRNAKAYAQALHRLIEDEDLRRSMGHRGQQLCKTRYRLEAYLDSLKQIFRMEGCAAKPEAFKDAQT